MTPLLDRVPKSEQFYQADEIIPMMIRHLELIQQDLTDTELGSVINEASLERRLLGFNSLREIFDEYMLEAQGKKSKFALLEAEAKELLEEYSE